MFLYRWYYRMSNDKGKWYVYILTNPSFREDWVKIWKTRRTMKERLKELDTTAIPLPFEVFATVQTKNYEVVENNMHAMLEDLAWKRINKKREFFNVTPEKAFKYLEREGKLCNDAEILWPDYYNWHKKNWETITYNVSEGKRKQSPKVKSKSTKKSSLKFSMLWIKPWEELSFIRDTDIKVIVKIDNTVMYQWKEYSLSPLAQKLIGLKWAPQWPDFFLYKWKKLTELREEMENLDK